MTDRDREMESCCIDAQYATAMKPNQKWLFDDVTVFKEIFIIVIIIIISNAVIVGVDNFVIVTSIL